ncbi:hypothetical protein [Sphingomonas sp.]|uniref:hypothetical protein n=1 Tax=Sphingomonas sp. TaxID=28214 RepID=UPI002D807AC7|nr:hypothetical protein [Sphingomonas sp.]
MNHRIQSPPTLESCFFKALYKAKTLYKGRDAVGGIANRYDKLGAAATWWL